MAVKRGANLKRYIEEALASRPEPKIGPDGPAIWPAWPYLYEELNAAKITAQLSTPETSQARLLERLKALPYPFEGRRRDRTFYDKAQKEGVLEILLNPPFLWIVRMAWFFQLDHARAWEQYRNQISQHGYPLAFHRDLMNEIAAHLAGIERITRAHGVPQDWLKTYRAATLSELLRQASVYYPEIRRWRKTPSRLRPLSLAVDTQMMVLDALTDEFAAKKIENQELAYQLTALICTPEPTLGIHQLDPTPDTVRKNDEHRRKKKTKK